MLLFCMDMKNVSISLRMENVSNVSGMEAGVNISDLWLNRSVVKLDNQIQQTNDDEKQATLWNQHEICPECKSSNIKEIDYLVHEFFRSHHEKRYKCMDCGCSWL